jgi:hypothetical protein
MKKIFGLLAVLTLCSGFAFGQATSGNLVGTVKDATGALIPNATINVTDEKTLVKTTTKSNSSGEFRVDNLLPSAYDVEAVAPGFQGKLLKGVAITLNSTATETFTLAAANSTTVEVAATAGVTLDTTSTNLTTTFSSEELGVVPTATVGFGVLNLSLLAPNVASPGGVGVGTGPSIGGQRPRNNDYTIEGIDVNDKAVTGPMITVPNDAVGEFTLITSQFSPEFGHSSGGQFNTSVLSGSNKFHGKGYEYFDNRNLNAENASAGAKSPNSRFDFNRYGGQVGGPIVKDKLFFFFNYERSTTGLSGNEFLCTPTAAGIALLNSNAAALGFSATNLSEYLALTPAANVDGGAQIDASQDNACFDQGSGGQYLTVGNEAYAYENDGLDPPMGAAAAMSVNIPAGNAHFTPPSFSNVDQTTASVDFTPNSKNGFRFRYSYVTSGAEDTAASLPLFYATIPGKEYVAAGSWFHTFTSNLINEARIGYNREYSITPVAGPTFPGLGVFPDLVFYDADIDIGPDPNGPQSGIQNLYQVTNNITYTKGKHTMKFGVDGRKYISPQNFIQRQRGDYEWYNVGSYLDDLAPDAFGERSSGASNYAGDQTAFYGYGNDTWRVTPKLTLNYGLRYEFTAVPVGERSQRLNAISDVPGLIDFHAPQPQYKNFAPRVGIAYAPDDKTSIRAGFGIAYDVLFDNLGLLTTPPQLSQTHDVGNIPVDPDVLSPNFLANGGLSSALIPITSAAVGRAATAAYLPDQILPYAESYNLTIQRVFDKNYTAEIQYVGTRGVHLPTQNQTDVTPPVTQANKLFTIMSGAAVVTDSSGDPLYATLSTSQSQNTYAEILSGEPISPVTGSSCGYHTTAFCDAGFLSKITSYEPYGGSNYNGLGFNVTRRFINGFQLDASYTWSKAMDDSTAEVNASDLTERRPENSRDPGAEYSRSGLDHSQRLTIEAVYDLPYFKHSNWVMKNLAGNWQVSPIYTYETPEYVTPSSETNSNLNGDSAAISRTYINGKGNKQVGSGVIPVYSSSISGGCGSAVYCTGNLIGYQATTPNAYYVTSGKGTLPTAERNSLAGRPIDNLTATAGKTISFTERYAFNFQAQVFNVFNHSQFVPGAINGIGGTATAGVAADYLNPNSATFNNPTKQWTANARTMQLSAKFIF